MRHPDEGQIHAWLDGALDPATAAGLEAHVAACPECAAAVAEARGLIAGASRILLALDNVPSGVIPAAPSVVDAVGSDDLAALRSRQHADTTASQRRRAPWYARRSIQVAASLMLAAGIGSAVVRSADRPDEKVFIQIETDAAPPTRGPAAGSLAPVATAPVPIAESVNQAVTTPPASRLSATLRAPVMTPAPGRTDDAFGSAQNLAKAGAASTRERVAEQQQAPAVVAEPVAAPAPPLPASRTSAPPPTLGAVGAPFASAATASLPAQIVVDSTASPLARSLADQASMRRSVQTVPGTLAGKVTGLDDAPIAMATVSIPSANVAVQTAADGSFTLPPLAPGRYTLEARRIGYSAARLEGLEIVAGDTAYAKLAMQANINSLSDVVVTGAIDNGASLGGACLLLSTAAPSSDRGIPLLPRRVRIQLADRSESADAGASVGAQTGARAPEVQRAETRTAGEPATPLSWRPKAGNEFEVTWPISGDVVTLKLQMRGSLVSGYATNQSLPTRSAEVSGRRVDCGSR